MPVIKLLADGWSLSSAGRTKLLHQQHHPPLLKQHYADIAFGGEQCLHIPSPQMLY